jgi:hypothetical protein
VRGRIEALTGDFGRYVEAYDQLVPFSADQLRVHRATIALRGEAGSVAAAIEDDRFLSSLRSTLEMWGLGTRGSTLAALPDFIGSIRSIRAQIEVLDEWTIDHQPDDFPERIWNVIKALEVVGKKAKIVAGTKLLRHLLPDLVVPMDRMWTGTFFQLHAPEWQDLSGQRRLLLRCYEQFTTIAKTVDPGKYADGSGWRTSRTKIIDNALIGYCKLELTNNGGAR